MTKNGQVSLAVTLWICIREGWSGGGGEFGINLGRWKGLTEVHRGVSQSHKANAGIVLRLGHYTTSFQVLCNFTSKI
jgi:hypothetical protein